VLPHLVSVGADFELENDRHFRRLPDCLVFDAVCELEMSLDTFRSTRRLEPATK
jgi:hypothetical protein